MQTILGSGGVIGNELSMSLLRYTTDIRQVSRNPQKVNQSDQIFAADLTSPDSVMKAVEGSEVVYLTVGLPYRTAVWKDKWPVIMENTINACEAHKSKLVFFDNVYMYGQVKGKMTEETKLNPISKKGQVRAQIVSTFLNKIESGNIVGLVARAADFYGPGSDKSVLAPTVFEKLSNKNKAIWLMNDKAVHSFTFTPDAGKATADLGNTPEAFGQVWHLPTSDKPLTGKEWIEKIALAVDAEPKYQVISKFMVQLLGLFNKDMRELNEMLYQYQEDYIFDSTKFISQFWEPTSYEEGIRITAESYL
ncbi:MAG TPA: NAD-dependent dehydratase [Flavobacteriales bacterium]|jgi:nucleoside-diphosphate-sugar epimerase|nr:NAD-dependent dehydratase [Flavobacteriales bacterium]